MSIQKAAVIGCGVMGTGISQQIAASGIPVLMFGRNPERVQKSAERIRGAFQRNVSKGRMTEEQRQAADERLAITSTLEDVRDADIIIEAISEDFEAKKDMFARLAQICREDAIIASNTSSLSITEMTEGLSAPGRFISLHFFNPVAVMKLVEIVMGARTSEETYAASREFCDQLGRVCVRLNTDAPGFIVNRVLFAYFLECVHIFEDGIASKEDIDTAIRYGLNHPLGPFHLMDMGGLDNFPAVCESLQKINEDRFRCPQPIFEMREAGKYGTKSGEGWYTYDK